MSALPNVSATNSTVVACQEKISLDAFTHASLGPAVIIICILSCLERRRNAKRCRCCGDRPGMIVPVNLLDGDENRLAYAAAFGCTATNILTLFTGNYIPSGTPSWITVFFAIMAVTEMGINYYPFFACLSSSSVLLGSSIGLIYSVIWFLVNLAHVFQCDDTSLLLFSGQAVVVQLPVLACLLFLVCVFLKRFIVGLCNISRYCHRSKYSKDDKHLLIDPERKVSKLMRSHQAQHVTELLHGKKSLIPPTSQILDLICPFKGWIMGFMPSLLSDSSGLYQLIYYKDDPTFHYSPRITATFAVSLLCLYEFGLLMFITVEKLLNLLNAAVYTYIFAIPKMKGLFNSLELLIHVFRLSWYTAFGTSSMVMGYFLLKIFLSYRLHIQQLRRGDHSSLPMKIVLSRSKALIMSQSITYSGTQIAYLLWGFYTLLLFITVICLVVAYLLVLPIMGLVSVSWLEPLLTMLPTVLVSMFLYCLQNAVSKRFFLQNDYFFNKARNKKERALALDNRRFYHNFSYFFFFFNILVGLYTCIKRIFKGMILGITFLSRLDRSGLIHGFEHWDTAFMAYVSFLYVEHCHTNPVLLTFCQILLDSADAAKHGGGCSTKQLGDGYSSYQLHATPVYPRLSTKAHTRWLKAYTILRNPECKTLHSHKQI